MVFRRKADPGDLARPTVPTTGPTTGPMRVMSVEKATGPQRIVRPAPPPYDLEAQLTAQGWLPPAQASFLMQQLASLRKLLDDMRWRSHPDDGHMR
jgi:hypothetical protein